MAREKRKFEVEDGRAREAKHSMGGRAAFTVPDGLPLFRPKKRDGDVHNLDVIAFQVSEAHNRFPDKLRYSKPGKWYGERTFFTHRKVGINDEGVTCIAGTFGVPCPICEARNKLLEDPSTEAQKMARGLKRSERQLFLIYDRDDTEKGIQLWDVANWNFGKHLDRYIGGVRKSKRDAYRRYYHPTEGFTMRLVVAEESIDGGKNYLYTVNEFYDRESAVPDEFWDHTFDLDAMIVQPEYKMLKAMYTGDVDDDDDGDGDGRETERGGDRDLDDENDRDTGVTSRNGDGRDERDSEPEPGPTRATPRADGQPYIFAEGDIVSLDWKGEQVEGTVAKSDKDGKIADVQIEGRERPIRMEFADLTLVETAAEASFAEPEPAKPAPRAPLPPQRRATAPTTTADDRTATAGRRPAATPTAPAKSAPTDDDEPVPPKKKR